MSSETKTKLSAPLERVEWTDPATLDANDYNPNVVLTREMELLEHSIRTTGWIQPILIARDRTIIDGFHRTTIARLRGWLVPCCVLDLPDRERIMLTVRINRAKGNHVALRMSDLVQRLLDLGATEQDIMAGIGATEKEIEILRKGDIFKALDLSKWQYSKAWLPRPYAGARK